MTVAKQSPDGKFVVCGDCGEKLCRRNERLGWGGAPQLVDDKRVPGRIREWVLAFDDGWIFADDHIERLGSAKERLEEGRAPTRRPWTNEARFDLSKRLRTFPPIACPACLAINRVNVKRLRVTGVGAAH